MDRVTVFSLEDCPHCQRAKSALKEREIPFTEISLSSHPHRRTDMLALSDRLTVPQIFFNDKHIGGADDTIQLLESWGDNALQRYQDEVAAKPSQTDERLRESTEPPVEPKEPPPRDESDKIQLPDGSKSSVLDLVERLKKILSGKDKTTLTKRHKHSFSGAEGTAALAKEFSIKEEDAVSFSNLLMDNGIIQPVGDTSNKTFISSKSHLFRMQCYNTPHILNSYRIWNTRVDPDAMGVVSRLKKLLSKIESAVTNNEGLVDYKRACENEHFAAFEEAYCELQGIDMGMMDYNTKLAFGINVYNLSIKFSFMKVGIHNDPLGLMSYFSAIKMNIGGFLFGFHDLESGILRGNRPPPYAFSSPIGSKGDPRLALVMGKVDNRIHFGLNCGAKSCPPVKNFTPDGIDEELRIVTLAFMEDDDNVEIDTKRRVLSLSQIINWYRIDFAPSNKELPVTIVQFLRGKKKEQLQSMIDDGKKIRIKFKAYDWSTNASDFVKFRKSNIQADEATFLSIC